MLFKLNSDRISEIKPKSFTKLGFKETSDLQEWLAHKPNALGEELLIIQKRVRRV